MEYCCHVWADASSCYLELLDKLQRLIRMIVGPSLASSLEPLAHPSELAQLVPLPFFRGRATCYSDRLPDFSDTIPRCYKDVYANSFFPHTAKLWNSLSIECLSLTYDLSGFKARINRHLLTRFFLNRSSVSCNLFCASFLATPCLIVAASPCMEWIPIKKKSITSENVSSEAQVKNFLIS